MNHYHLAKIVGWAGRLETRKRMQKVIYLLQVAGCPLDAEFTLHHYGPYSQDVARITDEMVRANLLCEDVALHAVGQQYSYCLKELALGRMELFEATDRGRLLAEQLAGYRATAERLFLTDLKELEYAATLMFFHLQGCEWPESVEKMCQFKGLTPGSPAVAQAERIARGVEPRANPNRSQAE